MKSILLSILFLFGFGSPDLISNDDKGVTCVTGFYMWQTQHKF